MLTSLYISAILLLLLVALLLQMFHGLLSSGHVLQKKVRR